MNRGLNSGARVNDMSRVDYAVIRVIVKKMEKKTFLVDNIGRLVPK